MEFGSRQMHSSLVTPHLTFMGRELVLEHTAKDLRTIVNTNLTCMYDEYVYQNYIFLHVGLVKSAAQNMFLTSVAY